MWFPQDLVGETEHFLKKWQLGGNKELLNNFVKFIDKQGKRLSKENVSRVRKLEVSRRKDIERRQNQSLCMHEVIHSNSLGKSQCLGNSSFLKGSRKQSYYPESKVYTESFIYDKL